MYKLKNEKIELKEIIKIKNKNNRNIK